MHVKAKPRHHTNLFGSGSCIFLAGMVLVWYEHLPFSTGSMRQILDPAKHRSCAAGSSPCQRAGDLPVLTSPPQMARGWGSALGPNPGFHSELGLRLFEIPGLCCLLWTPVGSWCGPRFGFTQTSGPRGGTSAVHVSLADDVQPREIRAEEQKK